MLPVCRLDTAHEDVTLPHSLLTKNRVAKQEKQTRERNKKNEQDHTMYLDRHQDTEDADDCRRTGQWQRPHYRFLLYRVVLMTVVLALTLATVNASCFILLFVSRRLDEEAFLIHQTCQGLLSVFRFRQSAHQASSWRESEGLLVLGFAVPLLAVSGLSYLLRLPSDASSSHVTDNNNNNSYEDRRRTTSWLSFWRKKSYRGDPNLHGWTMLTVLLPCLVVTLVPQLLTTQTTWDNLTERHGSAEWQERLYVLASVTGDTAVLALTLFLVPVAKHSPLLSVFQLSFSQALVFHKVAGWISLVFTILHGGLFLISYGFPLLDGRNDSFDNDDDLDKSWWVKMFENVIPPPRCFTWEALWFHDTDFGGRMQNSTTTGNATRRLHHCLGSNGTMSHHFSYHGPGHYECNHFYFNFTGFLSMMAFWVLAVCSLPAVRRRAYRVFYTVHIPAAWIMLLGAMAHITYVSLFLVPNIIYYLAPTVSVWMQQFLAARQQNQRTKGGKRLVPLRSVTEIANSNGCFLLRLSAPEPAGPTSRSGSTTTVGEPHVGAVCKICLPELSAIWHPFSTWPDAETGDWLVLIRSTGPFTQALVRRLRDAARVPAEQLPPPTATTTTTCADHHQDDLQDELLPEEQQQEPFGNTTTTTTTDRPPPPATSLPCILVDGFYPSEYRWYAQSLQHHDSILCVAGGVGIAPFLPWLSHLVDTLSPNNNTNDVGLKHVTLHWYCREPGLARFVCRQFLPWFWKGAEITTHRQPPWEVHHHDDNDDDDNEADLPESQEEEEGEPRSSSLGTQRPITTTTLDLCIHITSARPSDSSTTDDLLASFLPTERSSSPQEAAAGATEAFCDEDDSQFRDRAMDYTRSSGGEEGPSLWHKAYVAPTKDWSQNLYRLLWLTGLLAVCAMTSWWYYNFEMSSRHRRGNSILIRFHMVVLILVNCASFAVALIWLGKKGYLMEGPSSSPSASHEPIPEDEPLDEVDSETTEEMEFTRRVVRKRVCVSMGRPEVEDVVRSVSTAHCPGAILCGPQRLRTTVRNAIRRARRKTTMGQGGSTTTPCAFYDEQSDL